MITIRHIVLGALMLGAFAIGTVYAEPTQSSARIEIEMKALEGVWAARDDFRHGIEEVKANDKQPAYFRDINNYLVAIIVTDRGELRASFRPAPRDPDEVRLGGIETYTIDRKTGLVQAKSVEE